MFHVSYSKSPKTHALPSNFIFPIELKRDIEYLSFVSIHIEDGRRALEEGNGSRSGSRVPPRQIERSGSGRHLANPRV